MAGALVLLAVVRGAVGALLLLVRHGAGPAPQSQDLRAAPPVGAPPAPARSGRRRRVARAAVAVGALAAATALGVTGLARSFNSEISTVAGSATVGFAGDGGPATSAALDHAVGVAVTADGVVYIADAVNDRIRRVGTDGTITTIAGSGVVGWSGDGGPATAAGLNTPRDVAVDRDGNVYVADTYNDVVRKIDAGGVITTVAGTGSSGWTGDGGPATSLKLSAPEGVAVEADGDLLIADTGNHRIRRVDASGQMTTVAGNGAGSYGGDGGPATSAQIRGPLDVAPYAAGGFVIADTGNHRVRSVAAAGTISTLAGTGVAGSGGDGGPAVDAPMRGPSGVVVSGSGSVYVADTDNHRIRRVSTGGTITTAAGTGTAGFTGDGGLAAFARVSSPQRLASGPDGLYIADSANSRIRFVEGVAVTVPAPTVSAVSPAGPANDNAPEVTGTAPADSTVRLYTDAACTSALAASGTAADFASPGLTVAVADDSTTTFYATAYISGSATSACSPTSASYTEDSTPPGVATISDAPPSRSSDTTPTWTFSGPAQLRCRLVGPDGEVEAWGDCSSPKTPAALTTDGAYTLSVLTRDPAGNESTAATSTFTLDRSGPAAPAIGTAPAAQTNDDTPTFAFTGEADATFECRLWRDGATVPAWSACTTPYTPDISGQTDGAFTFRVRAVDAALNPGAEREATFTLDRVAPGAASFTGGTGAVGNDPDPSWTISAPAGATPQCRLDLAGDPDAEIAGWADCASPVTFGLSAEADGTYTVGLRSRDAAGNHTAGVTRTYVLDRVEPPVPDIDSAPPAAGAGTSPTWGFSGEADATFRCRVMRGLDVISGWATCSGTYTAALGGEVDGTYTFSVHAVDAAQNEGDPVSRTYTLDRQAPVISDSPPAEGNDETPTWAFAGAGAAGYQCRIVLDGDPVPAWTACASPRTVDLSERPDGTYTFSVRALDGLGDPSVPVSDTYVLDTAAPPAAAVTAQPSGVGSQAAASWSWTGGAGVAFECRLERDGVPAGTYASCTSPHGVDLTGSPDGTYRLSIRALDAVGNVAEIGSDQYVLDRVAPAPPVYSATPAPAGNTPAPSWSFASDPGASFDCQLERAEGGVVEPFMPCASPRSYDLAGRPDAAYVLIVRARDGAGNVAVSRSAPYGLDRAAPGAAQLTSAPGAVGNDPTPTWRFGATGATGFECGLSRGSTTLAALAGCGGSWTFDLTGRDDGAYTFRVRGLDEVGNPTAFVEDAYVLDTAAPRPPEIRGDEAQEGADESPTWRFGGEEGAILECQLRRGDDVIARMAVCATPRSYDLAKADDGTYTFTVRATDAAGNVGRGATATYRLDRREPAAEPAAESEAAPAPAGAPAPTAPPAAPQTVPSGAAPVAPPAEEKSPAERRAAERRAARREAVADAAAARREAVPDAPAGAQAPAAAPERKKRKGLAGAAEKLAEVGKVVAEAVGVAAEKSAFPGLLLAFCGVFLVVQDRIDRRDPKLALAPIDADPELEFLPLDDVAADETEGAPPCPA